MKTRKALSAVFACIGFVAYFDEPAHAGEALDTIALMAIAQQNCGLRFTDAEYAEWLARAAIEANVDASAAMELAKVQVVLFTRELTRTGTMDRFCDRVINTLANR